MRINNNPTFIVELKLSTELWQCHILDKRLEIARKMYNSTLAYALKQIQLMKESKQYRKTIHDYRQTKALLSKTKNKELAQLYKNELSALRKRLQEIRKSYHLTKYGLHRIIAKHQRNYKTHIDSFTAQKIADAIYRSLEGVLFRGYRAHFKKFGTLTSVEGKSNKTGIRYKREENKLYWNGLVIPVIIRKNDLFAEEVLSSHRIKFCRIVRKVIRGKHVFYLQLVMDGTPPPKRVKKTGQFRHQPTPNGRVGIDIGTSTIAVSSDDEVFLKPLAPRVRQFDQEKRRLSRKLDRSRRSMNPQNFNRDGTIKKGIKLAWKRSNTYMKTLFKLKELYRKRSMYVKEQHSRLANHILSLGDEVYVEKMSFKGLARRAKETKVNKFGKFQRKGRFGKSIGSYAPALFLGILKRKLIYIGKELHEINTYTFKASQYNHLTDTYQKRKLHQRWIYINKHRIQRDLYSAFLLMNCDSNLQQTNRERCKRTFEKFVILHHEHKNLLKNQLTKYPTSMGI
ncbi:hypothetical protein GCM10008025_13880 [Ornithinibacillus halotolerans]|uniref:Probable transposase IS891/IS1136/IS1341 domain-containing protein n=2 Tax=Ornithinibacillus halotolerans TaxID=1274357 RepID=A0A916RWN7_9BACI|nr:hypothetical protein GCM10008025_13880 [Ornithinibacillus halotolerans]